MSNFERVRVSCCKIEASLIKLNGHCCVLCFVLHGWAQRPPEVRVNVVGDALVDKGYIFDLLFASSLLLLLYCRFEVRVLIYRL